jgi:hypothetical protein
MTASGIIPPPGDRLTTYADFTDSYGANIIIRDSATTAREPCVWVFISDGAVEDNDGTAHLTLEQARVARDALGEFITRQEANRG